jgi:cysteine desulfurase
MAGRARLEHQSSGIHHQSGGRRVYFDHNATTPIHPEVAAFMKRFLDQYFGNPSSLHWAGREARPYVDEAREQVAAFIKAKPEEIVFTSGGTEADNQAIKGAVASLSGKGRHIITTKVEHPAVLNTCEYLESKGFSVTYLGVDGTGVLDPDDVRRAVRNDTILISVMQANNETGVVQPIREIGAIARKMGVLFHSDMVQALGKIDVDVRELNCDLASFSGHKVYGPKGVGALYLRGGIEIDNLLHGGGQEMGRRAGTENVFGIAAFGKACEVVGSEMAEDTRRVEFLRTRLFEGLQERIDAVHLNGDPGRRLPNTLNLSFEFVEAESLLIGLDLAGIAVSSGSACSSGSAEPSHVLLAMGTDPLLCQSAIRISLGSGNSEDDVDYALVTIPRVVGRLREMSPLYEGKSRVGL